MTKSAAKSKAGYIVYCPGEPLRKVAHRSVCSSKTVLPLKRRHAVARKSIPPRKLTLKKKLTARWSANYCVSLSVSDEDQSYDSESESGSSAMSCCSSEASNVPNWSSSYSVSVSDEDYGNNQCADHSDSSDNSSSGSSSSSTLFSSGSSSSDSSPVYEQPTVYVLCKLVNGVLVRV